MTRALVSPAPATRAPVALPAARGAAAAHHLSTALFHAGLRLRVRGREHVPASGPVILACNHTGIVDGPMLIGLSPRPVHTLVKKEMFSGFAGRWLVRFGQISIERGSGDRAAISTALEVLRAGRVLAIFPEGTRGTGEVTTVHRGVAHLALRSGAPVVPVAVLGTAAARSHGSLPRVLSRVDALFGRPVTLAADGGPTPPGQAGAAHPATRAATERARETVRAALADTVAAARAAARPGVALAGRSA